MLHKLISSRISAIRRPFLSHGACNAISPHMFVLAFGGYRLQRRLHKCFFFVPHTGAPLSHAGAPLPHGALLEWLRPPSLYRLARLYSTGSAASAFVSDKDALHSSAYQKILFPRHCHPLRVTSAFISCGVALLSFMAAAPLNFLPASSTDFRGAPFHNFRVQLPPLPPCFRRHCLEATPASSGQCVASAHLAAAILHDDQYCAFVRVLPRTAPKQLRRSSLA